MRRLRLIINLATAVLLSLWAVSCREPLYGDTELSVSLYIPDAVITKAEDDMVSALTAERKITSLQIWVFLSSDGTLVSYKSFDTDLDKTGIGYSTVTRFGLPLTEQMFALLSTPTGTPAQRPKVDVYAVANVASAVDDIPNIDTSRDELDQIVMTGFGAESPLTTSVPTAGLPLSGVLKEADVMGGYPVLNITTLKLTRAVSKIRFVFCQQETPATDTDPAAPVNSECQIMGISFDGGEDCQIALAQKLFTTNTLNGNLFDIGNPHQYTSLSASFSGSPGTALIANNKLACSEDPESLFFRSAGHEMETAEQYETRLNAVVGSDSQVGPIYLRETDKTISGTITYRTKNGGPDQTAHFSMRDGDDFSRNHSWIIYACFAEETKTLRLSVVVLPWDWTGYTIDYAEGSVNVIRRFTVNETTPPTFSKVQTEDGFFDVKFWHTIGTGEDARQNSLFGDIIIATPVGATLHVIPVPGVQSGYEPVENAITVKPRSAKIYPNYNDPENPGRIEHCRIPIEITCDPSAFTEPERQNLEGNYIDLYFCVEIGDGLKFVDLGSESIDYYRFILTPNWEITSTSGSGND